MKCKLFLFLFFLTTVFELIAQTPADSLAIVHASWRQTPLRKGMLCKEAEFASLYGVPQHITILEITPKKYRFDVLVHSPKAETSKAARAAGAVAAINGSYFDIRKGNSVCYLRKEGVVIDSTNAGALSTVVTGAIHLRKGKIELIPWNTQVERQWNAKKGTVLASGPLMLLDGAPCDLNSCNQNFVNTRHPRSAVCQLKDGKVLLVTVDGRFKGKAEGIRIAELAHLLRILGGKNALNLDGGGSTTLWSASAPDNGVLNKPCDNRQYDNQGERAVANSLCVYH
ncbi:phosphodiester glycosidase family protein [Bacteroides sp.]|uniref:phosphodiester glycosidase family protein n=1 Tax=Bacteroides sp. TaxID=29523 RepID=UPI002FC5FDC3